ncbi:MAG: ABC transporter permease subunit, partial [Mycolicibacterium fortuitum]
MTATVLMSSSTPVETTEALATPAADAPVLPDGRRIERRRRVLYGAISILTVLAIYTLFTLRPDNNPAITPTPLDVVEALWNGFASGAIPTAILASLQRIGLGFLIGAGGGVVLGSLIGWFKPVEYFLDPLVEAIRPIPPLAYIPLILIWFGIEETSRVIVLTLACFVTCIVNVIAGMKEVPQVYVDAA